MENASAAPDSTRVLAGVSLGFGAGAIIANVGTLLVAGFLQLWYLFPIVILLRTLSLPAALVALISGILSRRHRAGLAGLILALVYLVGVVVLMIGLMVANLWLAHEGRPGAP